MKATLALLLPMPVLTMAPRTMGELAHSGAEFPHDLKVLRQKEFPVEAAKYLIDKGFYTAALVGTIAQDHERNDRLAKFCQVNERILYNDRNLDTVGRHLGIGLQPQVNYPSLAGAVIANSESLTPRDLGEMTIKVDREVNCGAWLYSPFMPRRSSTGKGIAGHVDAFFIPDDGTRPWALTSLINPMLSRSDIVRERMTRAGFESFGHSPPKTLLEKLYADEPPNALVGNWNNVIATEIDEDGKDLTFARLAAAQVNKPQKIIYETMMITKLYLPVELYRQACLIRELQKLSKQKKGRYPLTIGTHCGINSCGQLTGALFNPVQRLTCQNLMDIYKDAISASTECWVAEDIDKKLEPFSFVVDGNTKGFRKVHKWAAKRMFELFLDAPTLKDARVGRSSYFENYGMCTVPHPDPEAQEFYKLAAEIALKLLIDMENV